MFDVIRHFPAPPSFDDDVKTYAAQLLYWSLIVLTVTELVGIAILFLTGMRLTAPLPVLILLNLITLYLLHRQRLQAASLLFVSAMWLIITVNAFTNRGILSPSVGGYALLIMFAAILLRERGALTVTVMSILSVVTMTIVGREGIITFPIQTRPSPETFLIVYIILFTTAGTLVYATARRIRSSYLRIRRGEIQLAERNRQLEQQIAERQQAENERDRLFDLSRDLMAIAGVDGYFKRLNPAFERVLGYSSEELLAQPFVDFIHPDDKAETLKELERLRTTEYQPVFENRYRCKDGSYRTLSWTTTPVGELLYAVARDITDQKLAEAQQREFILSKEKNQFLAEFLSTVSHDLKTPLSVINTNLYLVERIQDPDRQRDKIRQIKEQTALVEKFIQDILTVTRLDHLPGMNMQPVDLNALLTDIARQLRARAETKAIDMQLELADDLPTIAGDTEQLQRAFANLVDNGLNYTPTDGKVAIRTFTDNGKIAVEIADTGIGIREEDLPHIFDRFYRSSEARALEHGGTGLGLAIVKKVMDMHGYEIDVSSHPGKGTTFRAHIPYAAQAAS
jgi:PAS domain S-box-containing protein